MLNFHQLKEIITNHTDWVLLRMELSPNTAVFSLRDHIQGVNND